MPDPLWVNLVGLALLLVFAVGFACLLRWARCPGWSLVGGVLAGVLLGPTIMGRVVPSQYEHVFVGGVEERRTLDALRITAMESTSVAPDDLAGQREVMEQALVDARWAHQRVLRGATLVVIALTLLGSSAMTLRASTAKPGLAAPLSIGAWAAALPGAAVYFALTSLGGVAAAPAMLAAAAVAVGPWALTRFDRDAADRAEMGGARMVQTAGRVSSVVAVIAAAWAMWSSRGGAGLMWAAPLLALPASWLVPAVDHRAARAIVELGLVPLLGALVAVRIRLIEQFAFWPALLFLLVSGDGRWLGAFIGAMLPGGRRPLRTMRLVLGSMAAGPTQLAITAIALQGLTFPEHLPLAMLIGAVVIEVAAPARRMASNRLVQTEEEIERLSE